MSVIRGWKEIHPNHVELLVCANHVHTVTLLFACLHFSSIGFLHSLSFFVICQLPLVLQLAMHTSPAALGRLEATLCCCLYKGPGHITNAAFSYQHGRWCYLCCSVQVSLVVCAAAHCGSMAAGVDLLAVVVDLFMTLTMSSTFGFESFGAGLGQIQRRTLRAAARSGLAMCLSSSVCLQNEQCFLCV